MGKEGLGKVVLNRIQWKNDTPGWLCWQQPSSTQVQLKKKKQLIVKLLEGKECVRQGFYLPAATHSSQTSKLVVVMEQPGSSHISTRSLV